MEYKKTITSSWVELSPSSPANASVIWLHGLGADGHDFVNVVPELTFLPGMNVRFIFPHAPLRPVTVNQAYVMRAWFDIYAFNLESPIDEKGIEQSISLINELVEKELALNIPSQKIFLAGFSQGSLIALTTALHFKKRLGGVIFLSGYLPKSEKLLANTQTVNNALPIFVAHGTQDTVLPYFLGEQTAEILKKRSYSVDWHSYNMAHSLCIEEIKDLNEWLNRKLAEAETNTYRP